MRVIHVTPVYLPAWEYGGTVRAIHGMTTALVAQGHDVEVVTTTIGTPYAASREKHEATIDGVPVTYVPGVVRWGGSVAADLPEEVLRRASRQSVIHVSSGWQPAFRQLFAGLRRTARPYVYSPHGCFSPEVFAKGKLKKGLYYGLFEQGHLQHASTVVATSEMEAADLRRLDSSLCVRVVPNVIDAKLWTQARSEGDAWRRSLAIADDEILILQVCRPDPIKNTGLLVDALRQVSADRNYVLIVMGPGQSSLPADRVLPPHVRILRDEGSKEISVLRAAYSAAQLVAVPSLYECFGNVLIEAALCGTPTLAGPRVGAARMPALAGAVTVVPLRIDLWRDAFSAVRRFDELGDAAINEVGTAVSPSRVADTLCEVYAQVFMPDQRTGLRPQHEGVRV
jgi:glycosyltransferase involved in cell wall biosynthesis